ncbi:MAG: glycine cleavage system aminomethyltransferase GcvT [SAR202 cluster bacterium]|nr:glycine cleavage system aminomethyltransferase GcvT [SAR202 cluster bacterium]
MSNHNELRQTSLYDNHVSLGARMVPFSGWAMPVQYTGIIDEVNAIRNASGLFDVSHMGRVDISGVKAAKFLDSLLSFDVMNLPIGRARYGVICDENGGIIDDTILYRQGDDLFRLVPNAGNADVVLAWLLRWKPLMDEIQINVVTSKFAMIAHQGPKAVDVLQAITEADLSKVRPFRIVDTRVGGIDTTLARTGYTGEDGFELIVPVEHVTKVWVLLTELGAVPCGLGARDVLRLEAGLLLHGNEMNISVNPYEAGLERFVNPDREEYVARKALCRIRELGSQRCLVGFTMVGRGIGRRGHPITDGLNVIGEVTSGSHSPTLDSNIGLGYVPSGFAKEGTRFFVDVRGRVVEAEVTRLPFYSRVRRGT